MRLVPRSLRVRLVLVTAVGASVALVLCLGLLYTVLDRQLRAAFDADLGRRAGDVAAAVSAGAPDVVPLDPMAQLYDSGGRPVAASPVLDGGRLLAPARVRALRAELFTEASLPGRRGGEPEEVRVLARRLADGRVLAVGIRAAPLQHARDRLLAALALAVPPLVLLVSAAAWAVVRAALRPVDTLTREAAAISSLENGRRMPSVPGDDEIARLARTLDGMLARLRVAFDHERAFVDDASHELRTPIAVLRGEIELALSALSDARAACGRRDGGDTAVDLRARGGRDAGPGVPHDRLGEVERSLRGALGETERLSRLAENLLRLARAGSLPAPAEPVDVPAVVRAEADTLRPLLGLRVEVTGDPLVVSADADRFRQVAANLMANSAAAGATTLSVRVGAGREWHVVEFADDGPGFAPGLLESAMERFTRGDDARTRGRSGAGLGLPIARAVVAAHGGTMTIRNGLPLGGAVVTIRLPVHR
ncbi:sensor histidine kinase [Nonomuraea roseoviolacea]|uniref:histidine kinase n=1 Tax=Nonomuraea roseoviolacea subsp. carminata TaxID=160689 RepID=A0ABT1KCE2_9ACTN|nr:HAMP domain-containing sensor histidine kinase [Nonomuraea roseoviolacea]MCP2351051.1 signal transduction histidine kinase [Nonomuraea roseoviolacea subsp. carminata]